MKDHLLEHLRVTENHKRGLLYERWKLHPAIVSASEIANSAKHFVLRDRKTQKIITPKTKCVRFGFSPYCDIYQLPNGDIAFKEVRIPDYFVRLSDGSKHDLNSFMHEVLIFWKSELQSHGVNMRQQSFAGLSGEQEREQ